MLSPELLRKIQQLFIRSRYLANDVFAGEYETAFRGRGMEFEEVREYFPGDDIRTIDWNVTARMDKPFVKVFREEREQTMMLLVDASASGQFGSKNRLKKEVVAEIGAVLAFAAIKSNDKVGLIIFTDRVELFIPPKKGRSHVWHVISAILSFKPKGKGTGLSGALEYLTRVIHRRSICFVISDFLATDFDLPLKLARFKHELVGLLVQDPLEMRFSSGGLLSFTDLETGKQVSIDLGSPARRKLFEDKRRKDCDEKKRRFRSLDIDFLPLAADSDFVAPLLQFFRMREKRN